MIINDLKSEALPKSWFFMSNKVSDTEIGEHISALANTAVLEDKPYMYLLWGVDKDLTIIGSEHALDYDTSMYKNVSPQAQYSFLSESFDDKKVFAIEVKRAVETTIQCNGDEFIIQDNRITLLKEYPDLTKKLWEKLNTKRFEEIIAMESLSDSEIFYYLDVDAFYNMQNQKTKSEIIKELKSIGLIIEQSTGKYAITNLAAILFAKRITDFKYLSRKAVRVIEYLTNSKVDGAKHEQVGGKGYAVGFEGLIEYVCSRLPHKEVIGDALRKSVCIYPKLAIRELIANALIHQDLNSQGDGPMVEIYLNRIEISNPGRPLIEQNRFVDHPPKSRNELLASIMRRLGICEERGSGIDKVIIEVEKNYLPAPNIVFYNDSISITLYQYKPIDEWSKEDKLRACYYHACILFVSGQYLTNSTLRKRFEVDDKHNYIVSKIIKDAIEAGSIKPFENTAPRYMKYMPFWAGN